METETTETTKKDTIFLKDNLSGTVPVEIAKEVITNVKDQASMLKVCKMVPMESDTEDIAHLKDSGSASWVKEGEEIGTTLPTFDYPKLKACKLAVIVPITNEKINDSVINVMGTVKQAMADAFAAAIDKAMIFGTNTPFDTNLITSIGSNKVTATASLDTDISDAMGLVEDNKYDCSHVLMGLTQKKALRAISNNNTKKGMINLTSSYEVPNEYVRDWDNSKALAITGDFSKALVGTREGIEYKVLDQATIKSGTDTINLAQRDMIAIKATMRIGFVVAEPKAFSLIEKAAE